MEPARSVHQRTPSPLAEALAGAGSSILELCRAVGITRTTVARWMSGAKAPAPQRRRRVERFLAARGISAGLLFPDHVGTVTDLESERARRAPASTPTSTTQEEPPVLITSREYLEPEELGHWDLGEDPFEDPENPEDIYLSRDLVRIERAMMLGVERRQILAIIGDPGAGKSTLVRRFHGRSSREKRVRLIAPASLDRKRITSAALSVAVLRDLTGKETSSFAMEARSELLRQCLADADAQGLAPVMLIDEAHLLEPKALLAIKQLWDSHTLFRQLSVFMVGQAPLKERLLHDPEIRELTGRTRLLEIPRTDAGDYLRWRFSRVHGDADKVFDASAYKALNTVAEYPLWIGNRAVMAMRYAYQIGEAKVSAEHVARA